MKIQSNKKITTLGRTALACTASVCIASPAGAANIIVNGDFSSNAAAFTGSPGYRGGAGNPEIASWTFQNISGGDAGVNGSAAPFNFFGPTNSSAASTYAFVQNGTAVIFQNLPALLVNQTYAISFLAANRAGNTAATGRVQIGDALTTFYSSGDQSFSTAEFQTVSTTFTTPATFSGVPSIQLYGFTAGDNTVAYGNVFVEAVPEPSSAALLGIFSGLAVLRRRR